MCGATFSTFFVPVFLLFFLTKYRKNGVTGPPSPPGLHFVGNLHQLPKSDLHSYLLKLSQKYGQVMSLRLGVVPTVVISSARVAKEVLKTNDLAVSSRPTSVGRRRMSYDGLDIAFSPYNECWREMRKICTLHLFTTKIAQSFRPVREDEVARMIKRIAELATSSKLANISETVYALTNTTICRIGYSKRYDDDGHVSRRFHGLIAETQAMLGTFFFSDNLPPLGWLDKLNGTCARLEKTFKGMDEFFQELIDEHLNRERPGSKHKDIIDILLQMKKNELASFNLTFDHIKGVLMNIVVGGTDTSSAVLDWAMTLLIKNPTVLDKVQKEIRMVVRNKGRVDEDDLQKLPYLKAVVKETMRLHPPFPLLVPRETLQKCVLDGYEIPAKTTVLLSAWAFGRDPEFWQNPEEFLPDRFMGSIVDFRGNDFELIPFGAGRRGCPGISLGAMVVELALANLLYPFNWELPPGMKKEDIDLEGIAGLVVQGKNSLLLLPKICDHHI